MFADVRFLAPPPRPQLQRQHYYLRVEGRQVPGAAAEAPPLPRLLAGLLGPAHQYEGDDRGDRARLGLKQEKQNK